MRASVSTHWPLLGLRVATPRVELRPPDQDTVAALIDLVRRGIHDPDFMPFDVPWTARPSPELERESFRFFARCWANWSTQEWDLPFAVRVDGEVVGVQGIHGIDFPHRATFVTGSWLGRSHQGQGIGKEMRAAVLHFGFEGLGAQRAETGAFHDNAASLAVTRALGYEPNGDVVKERGGLPTRCLEFKLDRGAWHRGRRDDISIEGLDACRDLFGVG
ncbi:MAG TPA: GNAT family N-acetyltransferase [Acidimicrobiales bacterium]|nr:GNAT family N-acetyltransferase [Acidimicrobiales bacterium]